MISDVVYIAVTCVLLALAIGAVVYYNHRRHMTALATLPDIAVDVSAEPDCASRSPTASSPRGQWNLPVSVSPFGSYDPDSALHQNGVQLSHSAAADSDDDDDSVAAELHSIAVHSPRYARRGNASRTYRATATAGVYNISGSSSSASAESVSDISATVRVLAEAGAATERDSCASSAQEGSHVDDLRRALPISSGSSSSSGRHSSGSSSSDPHSGCASGTQSSSAASASSDSASYTSEEQPTIT